LIKHALNILVADLNEFLQSNASLNGAVQLHNIAEVDDISSLPQGQNAQIYCTLVNIEEETLLKNTPLHNPSLAPGTKQVPPMRLNLYLLLSFRSAGYDQSLDLLSRIMGYCQAKKEWNQQNTPLSAWTNNPLVNQDFRFFLDIYNISFEDSNNMWGNLGGKQMPFVIYKLRLVALNEQFIQTTAPPITAVIGNTSVM
jgi:hypothetical protein